MTNEELVIRIQDDINVSDNMFQLWQQVKPFIHSMAMRYKGYAEVDDLEQEGYLALYDAVDGFNPAAGCTFLTYAQNWIKQKMLRYIQNNGVVRIPVHEWSKMREYQKTIREFTSRYGREPTDCELCVYLNMTMPQLNGVKRAQSMGNIGSLDSTVPGVDGGEDATMGDFVADDTNLECSVLDKMQQEHLKAVLWSLVDALPDGQGKVIRLRYQNEMTLQQAGEVIGCERQKAYDLHRKGLRELRKPCNSQQLRPFLPEGLISTAYYGNGVESFNRTWTSSTERVAMQMI